MRLYLALQEFIILVIFLVFVQVIPILGVHLISRRKNATRLVIALSVYGSIIGLVAFFLGRYGITPLNLVISTVVILIALPLVFKIASQAINPDESEIDP
jgi:hypothetical protein